MQIQRTMLGLVISIAGACGMCSAVVADDVIPVAGELGLTPETAVISGLTSTEVQAVLSLIQDQAELRAEFELRKAEACAIAEQIRAIRMLIRADPDEAEYQEGLESLLEAAIEKRESIEEIKELIGEAAFDELSSSARISLARLEEIRCCPVPPSFWVLEYSQSQFCHAGFLLRLEARAERLEQELDGAIEEELASIRSTYAVAEAQARLETNLPSMVQVFSSFE